MSSAPATVAEPADAVHRPYTPVPRDATAPPTATAPAPGSSPVQPAWSARQRELAAEAPSPGSAQPRRRLFGPEDEPWWTVDPALPFPPEDGPPDAALTGPLDDDVAVTSPFDDDAAWAQAPPLLTAEVELVCAVVGAFDGYPGSLPAEGVRALVWRHHPALYLTVVEDAYGGRWDAFLEAHPDLVGWDAATDRLHLATSPAWAAIDAEREAVARATRRRLRESLSSWLGAVPCPPRSPPPFDAPTQVPWHL